MTIRVKGVKAARRMRDLMAALSNHPAEMQPTPQAKRSYLVHCPTLDASGEQVVLDRIPRGTLLAVEDATYKHPAAAEGFTPSQGTIVHLRAFLKPSG